MRDPFRTLVDLSTQHVVAARTLDLAALLAGARAGYAPYIGELRVRYGDELERAITPIAGDAAGEVVDDVFMALPRTLAQYHETGRFEAWLFTAAFNRARTRRRGERRRPDGEALVETDGPSRDPTVVGRLTGEALLERALAALPAAEREAWLLSYRGLEPREIAAELGIGVSAATVRVHRARKRLATVLGELTGD